MRIDRCHRRGAVILVGILAVGVGVRPAWASARRAVATVDTMPATRPAPVASIADVTERMRACIAQLVAGLASDDPKACVIAQEDLLSLHAGFLAALSSHAQDGDLEVRIRVRDLLAQIAVQARVSRILLKLPDGERGKIRRLRRRSPRLFEQVLSPDWSQRSKALAALAEPGKDPRHLASPLLVMSLRHPSPELATAAATAAAAGDYRSDAVIDALTDLLERTWRRASNDGSYGYIGPGSRQSNPHVAALNALAVIASPRAVPKLLELLMKDRSWDTRRNAVIADAIAASEDLRTIPVLMKELGRTSPQRSWWVERVRGSTVPADYALLILLKLTGQSPGSYGLLRFDYYNTPYLGFIKAKDRRAAGAKFKKWWTANKDAGPYKDLGPLSAPRQGGKLTPTPASAKHQQTASAPHDGGPVVEVQAFREELISQVQLLVGRLGSRRLRSRLRAHGGLLTMHRTYMESMIFHAGRSSAPVRAQLLDVVGDAVTDSRMYNVRASLPKNDRDKFSRLEADRPHLLRDSFSLSWKRRVRAMKEVQTMADPNALAEPLVVMALRGSPERLVIAAAKAVESGKYHSDRIVEALADILAKTSQNAWRSTRYSSAQPNVDQHMPHIAAMKAIGRVKNPNAAPFLLALMSDGRTALDRNAMLAEALAATGDRRIIPTLLSRLSETRVWTTMSTGKSVVTVAPCDPALMALIKLTGQDPKDYKLLKWPRRETFYGFRDRKQRAAAIKKFKDWWAENKTTPRYRDLKPITLPKIRKK